MDSSVVTIAPTSTEVITEVMPQIEALLGAGGRNTPALDTRKTLRGLLEQVAEAGRHEGYEAGVADGKDTGGVTVQVESYTREGVTHTVRIICSCEHTYYRGKACKHIIEAASRARAELS